jgi:hypothetical protein
MNEYGLFDIGFVKKPYDAIKEQKEQEWKKFFPTINLEPQTPQGQIIAIESEAIADIWELAELVYASFNIDNCSGFLLDDRVRLRGLFRLENESDDELKERVKEQTPNSVLSLRDELLDNLKNIDGVESVVVRYSMGESRVFIEGGDDLIIANTIIDYMPPSQLVGNTSVKVDKKCDGVLFFRPTKIHIGISLGVTHFANLECQCEQIDIETLKSAIIENGCGFSYGERVYKEYIRNILSSFKGVQVLEIKLFSGVDCNNLTEIVGDFLNIEEAQKAVICPNNLNIEYIEQ